MAYLPPHKRHSGDSSKPAPVPSSLIPQFNQTLNLGGSKSKPRHQRKNQGGGGKIVYDANSISRWWPVGSEDNSIPDSIRLEPVDCELVDRRNGAKTMVLSGESAVEVERPWVKISERVVPDLIDSARRAITGSESPGEEIKLSFVARMGKVIIFGNSIELENIKKAALAEADVRSQFHKLFYTTVPSAYMNDIQHLVVPNVGFQFDSEKEHYNVKVFDKCQPDSTISCKCLPVHGNQVLQVHKVELNQIRHLVEDMSCLYKDLDLRLILCAKRILRNMGDELSDGINKLISSAVIDPEVKGGLRWPMGKESVADRFSIVGVWHTKYKAFKTDTMRLKLRHADRFDHRTSVGETSCEVTIKLTGISKHLRANELEEGPLNKLVQEGVELIWNNFLTSSHPMITTSTEPSALAPPPRGPVGPPILDSHVGPPFSVKTRTCNKFSSTASFGASAATVKISVDASFAGAIIGKGGVNTKQICRVTGAKLGIRDHESVANLINIELEGTFDQINQASAMVRELIVNISAANPMPIEAQSSGPPATHPASNYYKTKLCEHFEKWTCTYGDQCRFAHGENELR